MPDAESLSGYIGLLFFGVVCATALGIIRTWEDIWSLVKGIGGFVLIVWFMLLTVPYWYLLNEYWWVPLAGFGAYLAIIWIGFGIFWI